MIDEYITADIMNGWWYCFKELLDIGYRKNKQRIPNPKLVSLQNKVCRISNESELLELLMENGNKKYKNNPDIYKSLLRFLKVVYTIGNLTPATINPGADKLDSWEYKLNKYKRMYHDNNGDIDKLCFQDYCEGKEVKKSISIKEFQMNPIEYMDSRVEYIFRRAYRIINNGEKISQIGKSHEQKQPKNHNNRCQKSLQLLRKERRQKTILL